MSTIIFTSVYYAVFNRIHKSFKIRHFNKQITGIEPASPAWEASILPMNYICISTMKTV